MLNIDQRLSICLHSLLMLIFCFKGESENEITHNTPHGPKTAEEYQSMAMCTFSHMKISFICK